MARRLADPQPGRERQSAHPDTIRPTHHASASPGFLLDRRRGRHGLFLLECFPVLWRTLTSLSSFTRLLFAVFFSILPLQYFFHSPTKSFTGRFFEWKRKRRRNEQQDMLC